MENVLFITNGVFVDKNKPEGGVRYCTEDFINLLKTKFNVIIFSLKYNTSVLYRIKAKLGIDVFEDYNENDYKESLFQSIIGNNVTKVFINLSSTTAVAKVIKDKFGEAVKVVLCSHGNESGDFLHQTVRFKEFTPWISQITSAWRLGKVLQKELEYRIHYFDLILTVSEIESAIENWLGAKKIFYVPRVYSPEFIEWNPVEGKVGFIADVSHFPNYYGLLMLSKALKKTGNYEKIEIRVVGKPCLNLEKLAEEFSFIKAIGYLDNKELIVEASTWMYYLNLVFYYSKGVSTKLAKGMNWGIPVISTTAGNRGYIFNNGRIITCNDPDEMAKIISERSTDKVIATEDRKNVMNAVMSFCNYDKIMEDLIPILNTI